MATDMLDAGAEVEASSAAVNAAGETFGETEAVCCWKNKNNSERSTIPAKISATLYVETRSRMIFSSASR